MCLPYMTAIFEKGNLTSCWVAEFTDSNKTRKVRVMGEIYKQSLGDCSLGAFLLCAIYHSKPQPQAEMSPAM